MLKVLQNPTTNLYQRFRNLVLSGDFAWHYGISTDTSEVNLPGHCLLYTSPSPRDATLSRMPSSA